MRRPTPHPNPSAAEMPEAIVYSVYELVHQWQDFTDERAKEFGLTGQQAAVVLSVSREQPSMRELADRLRCDASNITGLVDRLERRDLVCRVSDPHDARVKRVHLTPNGRQLAKRMRSRFFEGSPSVASLSVADQRALLKLLRRAVGLGTTEGARRPD
jgi:DNA-binding MarR family transcriptional regulator